MWHTEQPVAPAPLYLLSRLVRASGFKVVLTGEGADEILVKRIIAPKALD
jgi:asparagine synthase (glutamine-hydrolysing)